MADITNINGDFNDGPDQIIPSDSIWTVRPEGTVKLRIPKTAIAIEQEKPISIPGLLNRTAQDFPDQVALAWQEDGDWKKMTYKEYRENIRTCAKAFLKLGLQRHHAVCILGFNSAEWFISDVAAIHAGGVAAGIYTTNSSEACFYCAENSRANIIVVEDEKQLEKILPLRSRLPNLKAIVQYSGEPKCDDVLSWKALMAIGEKESDEHLDKVLKTLAINECCTLVYTSGTVGNPKAVMLSHDNLTWDAMSISQRLFLDKGCETIVSYLPLSHVAAQVVDIYITMTVGASVYFADKNALKGTLVNCLLEVQPTRFLGVPRVWEKIYEKMMQIAAQNGTIKTAISTWAKGHSLQYYTDKMNGKETNTWGYSVASSLIFNKVKKALGLSRCKTFVSAAAPLSADIKKYFMSIDIPVMEAFGMSEAGGAHTISTEHAFGFSTIGMTLPGCKTKISNPDKEGQGEICMYGRHIFMGYLDEEEKTKQTLDEDGWLCSGDIGYLDKKGLVYITGRIKELLITAGGENVAPVPIEQTLKTHLPHISGAMLIGDRRKFLSVLITLKTEVEGDGTPTDVLTRESKEWLKSLNCPADTVSDVLSAGPHPNLLEVIQKGIHETNKSAPSNAQRIQKMTILPADFSIPTGELGPTMKLKRNFVLDKYTKQVENMYM
ncbi:PREDICTED: long-chain-fatty-acid--CoA ligase ACSBG2 [Nicrophorus vespilloides]|uniref:long-chain-fatty-acid--CoA ligase n=1 Tax=Nicrophorus vespilloides TaxID=110193 RepID=A0ABM1M7R6_NICVS|nr:PREDICTED: long-chain-fatty-acid--CoA ligase ACSBG2 [Nicrophorus vespilloides]XP_017770618.1 PREDICTED: long-chain-fatty-acid--CoA ligase ACSBG2 [Nicrophorus vespilloides]